MCIHCQGHGGEHLGGRAVGEQLLGGAQMREHDGAGLAIDSARFDNLPVGVPPGGLFLEGGH